MLYFQIESYIYLIPLEAFARTTLTLIERKIFLKEIRISLKVQLS